MTHVQPQADMEGALRLLAGGFDRNPLLNGRRMRELLAAAPADFCAAAARMLRDYRPADAHDYLITLLSNCGFLPASLLDPQLFTSAQAIALARTVFRLFPQTAITLAKQVYDSRNQPSQVDERIIELLAGANAAGSVASLLARLVDHPNPRIRSKVALVMGRETHNLQWVGKMLGQEDARVRANAVEALWGLANETARALLETAARDENNRVAANALVGLYKVGEVSSIARILAMASDERELWKASAAWAMGAMGDPRFLGPLGGFVLAGQGRVRQNALRARARLKQVIDHSTGLPRFRVVLRALAPEEGWQRCLAAVTDAAGQPVLHFPETAFVLWVDTRMVTDFRVEVIPRPEVVNWGWALAAGGAGEWQEAVCRAAESCLDTKRKSDGWAVARCSRSLDISEQPQRVRLLSDPVQLKSEIGSRVPHAAGLLPGLVALLDALVAVPGGREMMVLAGDSMGAGGMSEQGYKRTIEALPVKLRENRIRAHVVLPPQAAPLVEAALSGVASLSGGTIHRAPGAAQLSELAERLCLESQARYQIRYRAPEASEVPLLRLQVFAPHGYGEDSCDSAQH